MTPSARCLTFLELDGLGFAAERGRFDPLKTNFTADELGPVLELGFLARSKTLSWPNENAWLTMDGMSPIIAALSSRYRYWVCPSSGASGVYRTYAAPPTEDTSWISFGVAIQQAATYVGFPRKIAAQLTGAIGEMQDNIYEHSRSPQSGVVAFRARRGCLEFVVGDSGVGVLRSITSCPDFKGVNNHGEALQLTLSDGVSRYGRTSGRGLGFRTLFTGLANLGGTLRFRSGDYALTINGQSPSIVTAKLGKKPWLQGFFVSVACRVQSGVI